MNEQTKLSSILAGKSRKGSAEYTKDTPLYMRVTVEQASKVYAVLTGQEERHVLPCFLTKELVAADLLAVMVEALDKR